jgi:hypothetical protein
MEVFQQCLSIASITRQIFARRVSCLIGIDLSGLVGVVNLSRTKASVLTPARFEDPCWTYNVHDYGSLGILESMGNVMVRLNALTILSANTDWYDSRCAH